MTEAITYLIAAFGLVGIGHKLDKRAPIVMDVGEVVSSSPIQERYFSGQIVPGSRHPDE